MRYIVTNAAGANLRSDPSCSVGHIIRTAEKGEILEVIGDWTSVNTAGGSTTTYLPLWYKGQVVYVSAALVDKYIDHTVTIKNGRIYKDGRSTLPLHQTERPSSPYQAEIAKHGCGVCSFRIAGNLTGMMALSPEPIMARAREKFGAKKDGEHYGLSALGMATLAKSFGIKAVALPVTNDTRQDRKNEIDAALRGNQFVCCWIKSEPFSRNTHHWICAVGYDADGKIVVANSGGAERIQKTTLTQLTNALYAGGKLTATGWMRGASGSAGIVIIG